MTYYYRSEGGYHYKVTGGDCVRVSADVYEAKCSDKDTNHVRVGDRVRIAIKPYKGDTAEGIVSRVLTSKKTHSRGKKVLLEDGVIGRMLCIIAT
jgi:uncharacterized repeat protein (TIGR03833 family)